MITCIRRSDLKAFALTCGVLLSVAMTSSCVGVDPYGDLKISRPKFSQNTSSLEGYMGPDGAEIYPGSRKAGRRILIEDQQLDHSGLLPAAFVNISNKKGTQVRIMYDFTWFDNQSRQLGGRAGGWESTVLEGNGTATLNDVAPQESAVSYRVRIRIAKR